MEFGFINGGNVSVCAFVVDGPNNGRWDILLPEQGFTASAGTFIYYPKYNGGMKSYCKTYDPSDIPSLTPSLIPSSKPSNIPSDVPSYVPSDDPSDIPSWQPSMIPSVHPSSIPSSNPSNEPSDEPTQFPSSLPSNILGVSVSPSINSFGFTFQFPATETFDFTHALCVIGTSNVQASSTYSNLFYTKVPGFQNGVKLWDDRDYTASEVVGITLCEGGMYLRPSLAKVSILSS